MVLVSADKVHSSHSALLFSSATTSEVVRFWLFAHWPKVLFLGLQNSLSQFVRSSCSVTVATLISETLSVTLFLSAVPNDRKTTLIVFRSAACSLRLFNKATFLGACSVAFLKNSLTDNEYLAFTSTVKRSHQSSQSVLGAVSAESQYAGNPDPTDALPDFATSQQFADSSSAML